MKISEKWTIFNIAPMQYDYIISLYGLTDKADAIERVRYIEIDICTI